MVTEIEQRLMSCNGDKFANLCRTYLSYRYNIVNSTGFVLAKEKSKIGTPDNFIPVKDFYIFNEITTTEAKKLVPKLKKDIDHCFNQDVVPTEKILKIILICNSKITILIQEELNKYIDSIHNTVELEIIGIDAFAAIIFREYPSLARQLGISIDTGQILHVTEFISQYEKSRFSTPLSNLFFNRDKEITEAIQILENEDLLIISGQAGVGKTKLSVELVERFREKYDNYQIKYVRANGILDIWDDLKIQLIKDQNYIIVVDDANKLKSNLDLILNFKNTFNDGNLKLIFTIRNYVKAEIQKKIDKCKVIELIGFEKIELKRILQSSSFNISEYYADKIYSISKGNARIAIMAAIAGINGEMEKLKNPSIILDEYFSSVNEQLNVDQKLMKTAGILSLFRTIDFSFVESIDEIEHFFNISKNELIENLDLLYKYEIADEFNNSYKISDQILGEYLFYQVFIKQNEFSFRLLLDLYVDHNKFDLKRLLNPIVTNYGFEEVKILILQDLKGKLETISETTKTFKFLKDFWFYLPTEALLFVKKNTEEEDDWKLEELPFEIYRSNQIIIYDDIIIEILINYQQLPNMFSLAFDLLVKYCLKTPERFTKLLKALTQSFIYSQLSQNQEYCIQIKIFDYLYNKIQGEDYEFYAKIILFIAHKYLVASQLENRWDGDFLYGDYLKVGLSEVQKDFRTKLLNFIFDSYQTVELKDSVLDFFGRHKYDDYYYKNDPVVRYDKTLILNFFKTFLPNPNFRETKTVYGYLKKLDFYQISYDKKLKRKYANDEVDLWLLLNEKGDDRKLLDTYVQNFAFKDYKQLLYKIEKISNFKSELVTGHSIATDSIHYILVKLVKLNFHLFLKVFELLFEFKFAKGISYHKIFKSIPYTSSKAEKIRKLIIDGRIDEECVVPFLSYLPDKFIAVKDYELFIDFFREEKTVWISFIEDIFEKFHKLNVDVEGELYNAISLLLEKSKDSNFYIHPDFFIFLHHKYKSVFIARFKDIEKLYLKASERYKHFDYKLDVLKVILQENPEFIKSVLESLLGNKTNLTKGDFLENDFTELWDFNNRHEIFEEILCFCSKMPVFFSYSHSEITVIFEGSGENGINFLFYIVNKTNDNKVLRLIYNIVVSVFNELKYDFLKIILQKNSSLDFFERLDFYTTSLITVGSRAPKINAKILVYEELRDFIQQFSDIQYLEHLHFIENEILNAKLELEWMIKREFLREWG